MTMETVASLLAAGAKRDPGAPAIVAPGGEALSCRELVREVRRFVGWLRSHGVGPGDRVAWVAPNGPHAAIAFLGSAAACTSAPLNPTFREPEFRFYLEDLRPKVLLLLGDQPGAERAAHHLGLRTLELRVRPEARPGFDLPDVEDGVDLGPDGIGPGDIALVLHTSGTTARPKQVLLSQRNLCASARNIATTLGLSGADRGLNMMPLFHIHGLMAGLLAPLRAGASVVCTPGFDARRVREWLDRHRPTWYSAVPAIHMGMRDAFEGQPPPEGGFPFRFVRSSSSALPIAVMASLEALFGVPVIEAYGMTEGSHQIASNPLPPARRKAGTVGLAAGPEIAIRDAAGDSVAPGFDGEIWIRGETVTAGYHDNPVANVASFVDGWFRTGDQGRMDADGYLELTGRLKELINRGGEKVAPVEIDNVLLEHPGVAQAMTCAVPHPTLGEEVGAVVVLRDGSPGLTARELVAFAAERLAPYKRPKQILIVPELPKGPTGKVQRVGLWEALHRRPG